LETGKSGEALRPVQRSNLVDIVISSIREMIRDRPLEPGQKLPTEAEMARQLGVGRSTIREALRVLAHLGLVESRTGLGTFVRFKTAPDLRLRGSLPLPDINEVYEFRHTIEHACAPLAAERRSDSQMDAIRRLWSQCRAAAETNDLERFAVADTAFHSEIVEASGNRLFADAYRSACPVIKEGIAAVLAVGHLHSMLDFHDGLVSAIERKDRKAALQAVNENFREAAARLRLLNAERRAGASARKQAEAAQSPTVARRRSKS
jgi:GntR family transcriptional regulator, transcriptional repressor for pyruvate dehydrogenase complex